MAFSSLERVDGAETGITPCPRSPAVPSVPVCGRLFRRHVAGHDANRRDPRLFTYYRVMQTARRAATSITYASNQGVAIRSLGHELRLGGRAVVAFGHANDLRDAVVFNENAF